MTRYLIVYSVKLPLTLLFRSHDFCSLFHPTYYFPERPCNIMNMSPKDLVGLDWPLLYICPAGGWELFLCHSSHWNLSFSPFYVRKVQSLILLKSETANQYQPLAGNTCPWLCQLSKPTVPWAST